MAQTSELLMLPDDSKQGEKSTANSAARLQEGGNNCSPKFLPKLGWDTGSDSVGFPLAAPSTQTLPLCVSQHENPQKELL